MRLTDAIFGRLVVDIRELFATMPSDLKADLDGEFLTAIAEHPNEILKWRCFCFSAISMAQPNSPRHAEVVAVIARSLGAARTMKMTAASPTAV